MSKPSIISQIGLKHYLDERRDQHNGRGYDDFARHILQGDEFGEPISIRKLARAYNVSVDAILNWRRHLKEQLGTTRTEK